MRFNKSSILTSAVLGSVIGLCMGATAPAQASDADTARNNSFPIHCVHYNTPNGLTLAARQGSFSNVYLGSERDANGLCLTHYPQDKLSLYHNGWYSPRQNNGAGKFCLNAHRYANLSNVTLYECIEGDNEQTWEEINHAYSSQGRYSTMIRKKGTNLCLNAHQPRRGSNVNLYRCTNGDPEQRFTVIGANITP